MRREDCSFLLTLSANQNRRKKMQVSTRHQGLSALTITLVMLVLVASGLRPSVAAKIPPSISRPKLVLRAGYSDSAPRKVPPPPGFGTSKKPSTATITVDYVGSWDAPAQAAFQYAVEIWESEINASVEIVVEAHWSAMGATSGILGGAMGDMVANFSNAPLANTWYPAALGHTMAGEDVNDNDGYDFDGDQLDEDVEIYAEFNRNFADWYFGTDGNTPNDKWDFASVVLHEIGHGLGFAGSMRVDGGIGDWGFGTPYPTTYDRFTKNGSGQLLITAFANNSAALAAQLQSDNLFFDGPNTNAANGGNPPKLYAPSSWEQGSSYSHLDEDTFNGTGNALMTPVIFNGETNYDPGPITRGIFQDMGWSFAQPLPPDLRLSKSVVGDPDPAPGEPVSFVLSVENIGGETATGIVLTDIPPDEIVPPVSWNASGALVGATLRIGTTYVWDLPDLAAGASGTINVSGTISPGITAHMLIVNQASISSDEDSDTGNNSSLASVGGYKNYLPIVIHR
jgi:uncharacterized repeat protein (TIGR01451 family)